MEEDGSRCVASRLRPGHPSRGGTIVPTGNAITWTSQTILIDDSPADDYHGAEFVTILSGKNVLMRQPPTVLHLMGTSWVEEPTELILTPMSR